MEGGVVKKCILLVVVSACVLTFTTALSFGPNDEVTPKPSGIPLPHTIYGNVTQPDGVTPAESVSVTVENLDSGVTLTTTTTSSGYYQATPDVSDGEAIHVTAVYDPLPESLVTMSVTIADVVHSYATQVDLELLPVYDLAMSVSASSQEVMPGGSALYFITLNNIGNMPDSFDINGTPPLPDWSTSLPSSVGPLPPYYLPGSTETILLVVTSPPFGLAHEKAVIDVTAESVESPGDAYSITTTTTVKLVIDIALTTDDSYKTVYPGGDVVYSIVIKNKGNGLERALLTNSPLPASWSIGFTLNPIQLSPWENMTFDATVHTYNLTPEGEYAFTIYASSLLNPPLLRSVDLTTRIAWNLPPVANAGGDRTVTEGTLSLFNASGSSDPDGSIVSYSWDFGDGNTDTGVSVQHAYGDDGTYYLTLTIEDDGGLTASDTVEIVVENALPEINPFGPFSVAEGSTLVVGCQATDKGSDDLTFEWSWGNGPVFTTTYYNNGSSPDPYPSPGGTSPFVTTDSSEHTYGDNSNFTLQLNVCDDDGGCSAFNTTVIVNNVAPNVEAGSDIATDEGTFVPLSTEFTDPGFDYSPWTEDFTSSVDWGDGTVQSAIVTWVSGGAGIVTTGSVSGTHAYGDNGNYQVSVTVCDDDGGCSTDSFSVSVENVNPSVDVGLDIATDEGMILTIIADFSDPGFDYLPAGTWEDFAATVDWGDGLIEIGIVSELPGSAGTATTGTVSEYHAYGDDGVYVLSVTVCDDDGGCATDDIRVTVSNIDPTVDAGPDISMDEGETVYITATFSDPGFDWPLGGTSEDFTAVIDWGDGTSSSGTVNETAGSEGILTVGTVVSTHPYGDNGNFLVKVTVCDDDGGCSSDDITVIVANLVPIIQPFGPYTVNEGSPLSVETNASDPGSDDLSFNWSWEYGPVFASIHFNDGVGPDPFPSPGGTYPFSAKDSSSHVYGDNYNFTLKLTVCDDDGGCSVFYAIITVLNVDPTIEAFGPFTLDEGSPITVTAVAGDAGSDDLTFTWSWQLGLVESNLHYNDGSDPDPTPSPWGAFPFSATDNSTHTYGDNYDFTLSLTVCDDDGGCDSHQTTITVNNVAPTIIPFGPFTVDEGSSLSVSASANDVGSDDLTFTWEWQLGPTTEATHYNDGVGPDPLPSPNGTFPFTAEDSASHVYGDNYDYTLTLTVCDDDGDCASYQTTIIVNNVAPTIIPFGPFTVDEGSTLTVATQADDVGSDDLFFTWVWGMGPVHVNVHYNDGMGPDPYPSPDGDFPFNATDVSTHTYGDNYNYSLRLTVCDDDGGCASFTTYIVVNNVDPVPEIESVYIDARITLRVAGEKWHNVTATLYEDGVPVAMVEVERYPGSPDNQSKTIAWHVSLGKSYIVNLTYDARPDWNPINGQIWGANPVWIIINVEGSDPIKLHHTFNVRHGGPYQYCYWDITSILNSMEITFIGIAEDAGSDDLTFTWDWGDGSPLTVTTYYNNGTGPDPYPSPNGTFPFFVRDVAKHSYVSSGTYTVTLTVADDDGGQTIITIEITIDLDGGLEVDNCTCGHGIHVGDPPGHGDPPGKDEPPGQAKKSKPPPKRKKK
jgi:PKD repeat protein